MKTDILIKFPRSMGKTTNMNYEQFAIWLHGFLEISNAEEINKEQTQIIKDHLALLFEKKTPDRSKKIQDDSFEHLKKLVEEAEKKRPKDIGFPKYPPYAPMPTYPGFDPYKITCGDDTTPPLPDLGTTVSDAHPCQEIDLGEQFVGVDMKFDAEAHKTKTYC